MGMYGRGYQVQWGTSGAWLWGCWGVASRCNVDLGGVATGYRVVAARCGGGQRALAMGVQRVTKGACLWVLRRELQGGFKWDLQGRGYRTGVGPAGV